MIRQVFVDEDTLYSALLYIYRTYIGDITELVTEDEFLEKFKEWYLND